MGIFTTPVGGAAVLGFLFSLLGLYFLALYILDGIENLFRQPKVAPAADELWTKEELERLERHQDWMATQSLCREIPSMSDQWRKQFNDKWYPKKESGTHTQTHSFSEIF